MKSVTKKVTVQERQKLSNLYYKTKNGILVTYEKYGTQSIDDSLVMDIRILFKTPIPCNQFTFFMKIKPYFLKYLKWSMSLCYYLKDTEPSFHSFLYSLVSLLSGIYPFLAMHSLLVTVICYNLFNRH